MNRIAPNFRDFREIEMNHEKFYPRKFLALWVCLLDQQWITKIVVWKKLRRLNHECFRPRKFGATYTMYGRRRFLMGTL